MTVSTRNKLAGSVFSFLFSIVLLSVRHCSYEKCHTYKVEFEFSSHFVFLLEKFQCETFFVDFSIYFTKIICWRLIQPYLASYRIKVLSL